MILNGRVRALLAISGLVVAAITAGYFLTHSPRGCDQLVVASSPEKSGLLSQLAAAYNRAGRSTGGRCVQVGIDSMTPLDAERYFASPESWPGPPLDVWSPSSGAALGLLSTTAQGGARALPANPDSLFVSPLVIAVPQPAARALGWHDLAGLRIGMTNPAASTEGLDALIAAKAAGGDDLVTAIQAGVDHYGSSADAFLLAQRAADDAGSSYLSAIVLEEQEVDDYNRGLVAGEQRSPPRTPLAAIYPREGSLVADHPYAILKTSPRSAAAHDFFVFLSQAPQQQAIAARGFSAAGSPAPGPVVKNPDALALQALLTGWRAVRKPAHVLVLLDATATQTPSVAAALAHALTGFQARDQVGVRAFPAPGDLVAISPAGTDQMQALLALRTVTGGGGLDDAVQSAVRVVAAAYDPNAINAVLLVEPEPSGSGDALQSFLRGQPSARFVHLFTIGPPNQALDAAALAGQGGYYRPGDAAHLVSDVISNF